MGRAVKRGEKGIAIFAPMRIKPKCEKQHDSDKDSEASPQLRFRIVHVFDVDQTEGKALPEPPRVSGDPGPFLERLEFAVRDSGIELADSDRLGEALGVSMGGKILIHPGLPVAERFSVLVHEWAHEMLHKIHSPERPDRTTRELEAEAVAFIVDSAIGLNTGSASADYIRLYNGDNEKLASSLDRIQRTACAILEAVQPRNSTGHVASNRATIARRIDGTSR